MLIGSLKIFLGIERVVDVVEDFLRSRGGARV
jgi:hypothetical protein